jgi:Bacterial PH domain
MSNRPWWALALQWTLWFVLMTVVMRWLGKNRFQRRRIEEIGTLRHPTSTLVVGLVCFCFFAALTVWSAVTTNKTATWWTTAGFAAFAAMSVPMILDYFMARHRLTDGGLAYRKLAGTTGFFRWSELRSVRYAQMMKWFRLETTTGDVLRISAMLIGLPEFARALLSSAPAGAMDADTRRILEATAEGNPPSLWT